MNQKRTKQLRKYHIDPFAEGDPRNKGAWRRFKDSYNKIPRSQRKAFMNGLERLQEMFEKTKITTQATDKSIV